MDQVVPTNQDRLRQRDQQPAPAQSPPPLLERLDRVDRDIQPVHQPAPIYQLAHQQQASMSGQPGVIRTFVNGAAMRGRVHLKRASWWGVGGIEASPLSQFQRHVSLFNRSPESLPYSWIQV
jgi:hypothetical protein